jgi:hypothetical protein
MFELLTQIIVAFFAPSGSDEETTWGHRLILFGFIASPVLLALLIYFIYHILKH